MKKYLLLITLFIAINYGADAQLWSELISGSFGSNTVVGTSVSICSDKYNNIYAAGQLYDTGAHPLVAKWNGTAWSRLDYGIGVLDSLVNILQIAADTSGNIYAAGEISDHSNLQYIAKWNGSTWSKVGGNPFNAQVLTICFDRYGNLYAAGCFTDTLSDSVPRTYVAKWDGSTWSELGTGPHALNGNNVINSLCTDTFGNVYAAGVFTDSSNSLGGNLYVAKWDGSAWSELGRGTVRAAVVGGYQIFSIQADAAGNIYAAGKLWPNGVMKWDGSVWSRLGAPSDSIFHFDPIFSLCFDPAGNLYAAGTIMDATTGQKIVAKWNGAEWTRLGAVPDAVSADDNIYSVCSDAYGNIYAGGAFRDTMVSIIIDSMTYYSFYVAKYTNPATGTALQYSDAKDIIIYPNPTCEAFNIDLGGVKTTAITLTDATGRVVRAITPAANATTVSIPVSGLSMGLYIVALQTEQGVISRKIIVGR